MATILLSHYTDLNEPNFLAYRRQKESDGSEPGKRNETLIYQLSIGYFPNQNTEEINPEVSDLLPNPLSIGSSGVLRAKTSTSCDKSSKETREKRIISIRLNKLRNPCIEVVPHPEFFTKASVEDTR